MSPIAYLLPLMVWLGVLIVSILCVYIAWRALFGDRSRGRRRCPHCWYDMAYSPGMTCAECGHVVQREEDFHRTRRRPGIAALAILMCVVLVLAVNDRMSERGMIRHVPTTVLIWVLPIAGGMDGSIGREIDRRASARQLTTDHWVSLMERCAAGGWFSRPTSNDWIEDYGDFITAWRPRFLNDATLEAPLMGIPPHFDARTRDVWPEGASPVVAVSLDDWWPAGMECRVRATPRVSAMTPKADDSDAQTSAAGQSLTFYRSGEIRFRPTPFSLYLPPMPPGAHEIVIDFQLDRRRMRSLLPSQPAAESAEDSAEGEEAATETSAQDEGWEEVGAYSVTLRTRIEGKIDEMMQPVSGAALDTIIQQAFGQTVRWTGDGLSPVRFGINAPVTFASDFNDTAIGVSVELEREGVVARRLNLWWIAGSRPGDERRGYGFEIHHEDLALLRRLDQDDGSWLLRVRSDPLLALRAGAAKQYWKGEVTVPINLRVNQSQPPSRLWWTEGEEQDATESENPADAPRPPRRGGRRAM